MMKSLILIIAFFLLNRSSYSQPASTDKWISEINDDQIHFIVGYAFQIKMISLAGDSLLRIGKPVTKQLLSCFSVPGKGIIAHYLLSVIWGYPLKVCDSSKLWASALTKDDSSHLICGLPYLEGKNGNYARQQDIEHTKALWVKFVKGEEIR
jgi:hypothetical protein